MAFCLPGIFYSRAARNRTQVKQLELMGFSSTLAKATLLQTAGNMEKTLELLIAGKRVPSLEESNGNDNDSNRDSNKDTDFDNVDDPPEERQIIQEMDVEREKRREEDRLKVCT